MKIKEAPKDEMKNSLEEITEKTNKNLEAMNRSLLESKEKAIKLVKKRG